MSDPNELDSNIQSSNVFWHEAMINRAQREQLNQHRSAILWFTGLSGSGKSTLAHAVEHQLYKKNCRTFVFDGDNVRHGLCGDLGFSQEDRTENIRRVGQMARLFIDAGVIAITAFISPFRIDRDRVRLMVEQEADFIEVYCRCPISVCEERDVKGLYKRARKGDIADFTGISSPYEEPQDPALVVDTDQLSLDACVDKVVNLLYSRGIITQN